ncbi:MAG TPA: zinc ribbon domain-containing protein [Deltaproteobacteria bacterium]|nr:zinc ribbon domain-containing protein [Deltaproteobacteria bacterium]
MPIYEYRCTECDKEFEMMQKFSEDPLKECIYCGGPVEKLISLSSFHLKGSGWYLTDYARKKDDKKAPESCPSDKKKTCGGC